MSLLRSECVTSNRRLTDLFMRRRICSSRTQGFTDDVKCYFTAPARWDAGDWIYFGGVVAAVGLAHHYDEDVRTHFVGEPAAPPADADTHDKDDALPAAGVLAATGLYALATLDRDGRTESWQMLEAAG